LLYIENLAEYFLVPVIIMIAAEKMFSLSRKYQNLVLQMESAKR